LVSPLEYTELVERVEGGLPNGRSISWGGRTQVFDQLFLLSKS